jgi:archaellum component FlaF (FlaF/FlaG flagellin family)
MKFVRHRRGLSNVVTAAIMLTSVAVMGSAMVSWANGNLKAFETGLANSASDKTNKINENISIENVWFCNTCQFPANKALNVTLTNVGNLALNVTDIKIIDPSKTNDYPQTLISIFPGKSHSWKLSFVWTSQIPVNIYVTTARGSIYPTQAVPP